MGLQQRSGVRSRVSAWIHHETGVAVDSVGILSIRWYYWVLALLLTGFIACSYLLLFVAKPVPVTIAVDMKAVSRSGNTPGRMEFFVNTLSEGPYTVDLVDGRREIYTSPSLFLSRIEMLRVDPGTAKGVFVTMYGISVLHGERTVKHFGPKDIAKWAKGNVQDFNVTDEAVSFMSASSDPVLSSAMLLPITTSPGGELVMKLKGLSLGNVTIWLLMAGLLGVVLADSRDGEGRWRLVAMAAGACAFTGVAAWALWSGGHPPDQAVGISLSTYMDDPKSATGKVLLATLVFPVVAALMASLRKYVHGDMPIPATHENSEFSWAWLWLLPVCASLSVFFFPHLSALISSLDAWSYQQHWDVANHIVWKYMTQSGYTPFVDYWYPYGAHVLTFLPPPDGELMLGAILAMEWSLLLLAIYCATGRRLLATLALFFAYFCLDLVGAYASPHRYGLVILPIILSYIGTNHRLGKLQPGHVIFWASCMVAVLFDPINVVYAGGGVFLHLVYLAFRGELFTKRFGVELLRMFLVPAVLFMVLVLVLALGGMLKPIIQFYARIGGVAAVAAYPVNLFDWLFFRDLQHGFVLWCGVSLAGYGAYSLFRQSDPFNRTALAPLLFGFSNMLLMIKCVLRPPMASQILPVSMFALAWTLGLHGDKKKFGRMAAGAVLACVAILIFLSKGPVRYWRTMSWSIPRLQENIGAIKNIRRQQGMIVEELYSLDRFKNFKELLPVAQELSRKFEERGSKNLFIVGDEQYLYIMSKARPMLHINLYDSSPNAEELYVVSRILGPDKPLLLWPGEVIGIDRIPMTVRSPILFSKVVEHFVPGKRMGRFVFLERRQPGQPVDFTFWREELGATLELGSIPRYSSIGRMKPWKSGPAAHFLKIRLDKAQDVRSTYSLPITVDGLEFNVAFAATPGVDEYTIYLNRLWFWSAGQAGGVPPIIGQGAGFSWVEVKKEYDADMLY